MCIREAPGPMARLRCTEPFTPRGSPALPAFTMPFMRKRHRTRWLQNRRALAHRLMEVRKRLAPLPIGSQNQFLNFPKGSLSGLTPVQALRRGLVTRVMTAARGHLER